MKQFHESQLIFNRWAFTTVADWKGTIIEKSQRALLDSYCTIYKVCSVLSVQDFTRSSQYLGKVHLRVAARSIAKYRP